ncbi:hypothetical protein SPAN111604_05920 [Sphingomonas antarctica]|uniref:PEPxxWA-CTERM sorting domain-containing protein n=1 Tax=Sphingomonas antarctica TaxID=2040274 RepID=UPI0039EB3AEB
MAVRTWILGLALLGVSGTAVATPTQGKLKPGAAVADFLVNVYATEAHSTQQGATFGSHTAVLKKGSAQTYSRKKPSAAVRSKAKAGPTVQATAYSNLSYDYVFHAKSQTAFDQLTAYAATHDGTNATISGYAKQAVKGSGSALTSIDAGAAITASFACTDTGGDCNDRAHHLAKYVFTIPGAVTISDAVHLDFAGHIFLTSLANAYTPKSQAFAFIDPEVALPGDFGGDFSDFSIELSDGIDNAIGSDAVPEPNSWALLIMGFGVAGGAMRRRGARVTV